MQNTYQPRSQAGIVSILTMIFFMIFSSILIVGFIKIMSDEQRQVTDNDLSASALAAAQGGIEDGKRIIAYCATNPGAGCNAMLSSGNGSGDCSVLTTNPAVGGIRGALGITVGGTPANVRVGEDSYEQFYTCMTIKRDTDTVTGILSEGTSEIIPLNTVTPLDQLSINWSAQSGSYAVGALNANLETRSNWLASGLPKPPLLRAQLISYTPGSINLDAAELDARTVFIAPANTTASVTSVITSDARSGSPANLRSTAVGLQYAPCSVTANNGYSCNKTLTGLNTARKYYLRLSVMYGSSATFTLSSSAAGVPTQFNNVQPEVDATGRANDVFRRIVARVRYAPPNVTVPEYALESAGPVCKNIVVTSEVSTTNYGCDIVSILGNPIMGIAQIGGPQPGGGGSGTSCRVAKGWFDPTCWRIRLTNQSQYAPGTLQTCTWNWGDGTVDTYPGTANECQYGTQLLHYFTPQGPEGTFRYYTILLTINLNNGTSNTSTYTVRRPN